MISITKTLIILVLIALVLAIANDNRRLTQRNARLERAIKEVVYTNGHHIPGYIEPSKVVKDIQIRRLVR